MYKIMQENSARSFVMVMIVIAVSSLLLRIAIDSIIKINMAQNESNAQGTLKLISAALENYAKDHNSVYPASLSDLTKSKPSYLDEDYIRLSPAKGYNYTCTRLEPSGYSCFASPTRCQLTANTIYTITTGSLLVSEGCERKE